MANIDSKLADNKLHTSNTVPFAPALERFGCCLLQFLIDYLPDKEVICIMVSQGILVSMNDSYFSHGYTHTFLHKNYVTNPFV